MASLIKTVIQFRRDVTANWEAYKHIVPAAGEPCYDLELHTLKIGDGTTSYGDLPVIGAEGIKLDADGKSLVIEEGILKLLGFDAAEVGAQPRKNADGNLEWVVPSTETVDGLKATVAGLQSDVTSLQNNVTTIQEIVSPSAEGSVPLNDRVATLEEIINGTGDDSVDAKIDAKINEFATKVSDDGTINTIKELVDYVADHGPEAANMAADITALQGLVGETSVEAQIEAAMGKHETKASAVFSKVKYEISSKPTGTLVDYSDKEIRVMVPSDAQFELQNSGENADANAYYIGFKAYAPDGAVNFKEDLAEIIADNIMYSFEGNEFAGVDAYGRKYSIVWLPVAAYDEATATWTYYGASSSKAKYIGWHYSVEWYDVNGKKIDSDCIRINLSNEACHNVVEPYYMASVVKGVSVGGTLLDVVNGIVEMPANAGLKSSDEIVVNEDGTLSVGAISVSKIAQTEDEELVLNGGGAAG